MPSHKFWIWGRAVFAVWATVGQGALVIIAGASIWNALLLWGAGLIFAWSINELIDLRK